QPDVEERLMGALQGLLGRQAGELAHEADEADTGHAGDEGVVLGHVAHQPADLLRSGLNVGAEDAGRPRRGRMEPEERVKKSRLAGAVGTQQADAAAGEGGVQSLEDWTPPELDLQALELDDGLRWIYGHHGLVLQGRKVRKP